MVILSALRLAGAGLVIMFTTGFLRLLYILPSISRPQRDPRIKYPRTAPSHLVIVLGSGGHTAEMMSLMRDINPTKYIHRTYIVSSGDSFSSIKALDIETTIQSKHKPSESGISKAGDIDSVTGKWDIKTVPRARKIHQPLYTTPLSSLWCFIVCMAALRQTSTTSIAAPYEYPDVIITNGPATAVIVIIASFSLKFLGFAPLWKMKTVYVESWARVTTLSLSGKILLKMGICDKFLVQWEALAKRINGKEARKKVEWEGFLVE